MNKDWKEFIEQRKKEYKKIGQIKCLAFGDELVYFNKDGFNHLLRKHGKLRPRDQQLRRLNLLPHAPTILRDISKFTSYSEGFIEGIQGKFWTICGTINGLKIKVVIRQLNNGRKQFFSIMDYA